MPDKLDKTFYNVSDLLDESQYPSEIQELVDESHDLYIEEEYHIAQELLQDALSTITDTEPNSIEEQKRQKKLSTKLSHLERVMNVKQI